MRATRGSTVSDFRDPQSVAPDLRTISARFGSVVGIGRTACAHGIRFT